MSLFNLSWARINILYQPKSLILVSSRWLDYTALLTVLSVVTYNPTGKLFLEPLPSLKRQMDFLANFFASLGDPGLWNHCQSPDFVAGQVSCMFFLYLYPLAPWNLAILMRHRRASASLCFFFTGSLFRSHCSVFEGGKEQNPPALPGDWFQSWSKFCLKRFL